MTDMVWRWNGVAWVEYTAGGLPPEYHIHTIDQVAGLQAELDTLDVRIDNVQVPAGSAAGSPVDIFCPGDLMLQRINPVTGQAIPAGSRVIWHKATAPTKGTGFAIERDGWQIWDGV